MESTEKVSFQVDGVWFDFVFLPERSAWVATTPLTNSQSNVVCQHARGAVKLRGLPQELSNPKQPRTMISWQESIQLCNALSSIVGLSPAYDINTFEEYPKPMGFRLPSWDCWLSAYFAGDLMRGDARFFWGDDPDVGVEYAVTAEAGLGFPATVATRMPNMLGIFDLLGLVHEWGIDSDEELDNEGNRLRQSFGGSYEDRLLIPTEGEVGAWPEKTHLPTIGLRLYVDDSEQFRSLQQAIIEPLVSSSPNEVADTASDLTSNSIDTSEPVTVAQPETGVEGHQVALLPSANNRSGSPSRGDLTEALYLWSLVEPSAAVDGLEAESVLAFSLTPFEIIVAPRGAGAQWLRRWSELRESLMSRPLKAIPVSELLILKEELAEEFILFTDSASGRNETIPAWDRRLINLQHYLPSEGVVGNAAFEDDYFYETAVLYKELESLLRNYEAMRAAFDAIMKDAGLVGAAILTGWLTETSLCPANPDVGVTVDSGCTYPANTLADCLSGLQELEKSLMLLCTRTSTESRLTPALARQMWVTLPNRLLDVLGNVGSITGSDEMTRRFLDLCGACGDALRRLIQTGSTEATNDALKIEQEPDPLPDELGFLDDLAQYIPEELLPARVLCHAAELAEDSEHLSEMLTQWDVGLSAHEQGLQASLAELSRTAFEVKDLVCVKGEVDHLQSLLEWFSMLLEGGGKRSPTLDYFNEVLPWPPELIAAYKANLLKSWHIYQLELQHRKAAKVRDHIVAELRCEAYPGLRPPDPVGTDFNVALAHLFDLIRGGEDGDAHDLSQVAEAWRDLEEAYSQVPDAIPSLNPIVFFVSRQQMAPASDVTEGEI